MKTGLQNLPRKSRSLLLRLFVLIEEIDKLEDEHPGKIPDRIKTCIDVLRDRVETVKQQIKAEAKD